MTSVARIQQTFTASTTLSWKRTSLRYTPKVLPEGSPLSPSLQLESCLEESHSTYNVDHQGLTPVCMKTTDCHLSQEMVLCEGGVLGAALL